jgi:Xaa-Pro aminopeptidase
MVLTVEPGLYVSRDAAVDPKWQGIGVRIEDDVAVTENGYRNLTEAIPKAAADHERILKAR